MWYLFIHIRNSCQYRLDFDQFSILFTGDIEKDIQNQLLEYIDQQPSELKQQSHISRKQVQAAVDAQNEMKRRDMENTSSARSWYR